MKKDISAKIFLGLLTVWKCICIQVPAGICAVKKTACLMRLEGKRAIPRTRPPYAVTCGLWGKPTVVNNVETLANVPHIITNGPEWFRKLSYTR